MCRIKNQKKDLPLPPALPPDAHAVKGWVSGTIYPDDVLFKKQEGSSHLVMHTALGDITIQLLPELAPASVREIQRMAKLQTNGLSSCRNCRMYRCAFGLHKWHACACERWSDYACPVPCW